MLNFVDAEALLAPGLNVPFPDLTMIRKMRQEATLLGEGVAAYRIASAKRIVSFGFDETTKFGDGLASTNFQIETASGEICDEVLRGAFLIPGGCADQVAKAIELKLFARGRQLLDKVRSIYESKHGDGSWPGPKPVQLSYRRLAGALVMSDTCHAARAAKNLIIEFAAADVEKALTDAGLWDGMDATQRQVATRAYVGDCTQHLRNILLDAMSRAASSLLKEELQESLDAFSSYERMTTEPIGLIRAVYKEFHQEGVHSARQHSGGVSVAQSLVLGDCRSVPCDDALGFAAIDAAALALRLVI